MLNVGGGLNTSTFSSFYNNSSGECRQYGRITVTDTGSVISVNFQGWDAVNSVAQVSTTDTFDTTQPSVITCVATIGSPAPNTGEKVTPAVVAAVASISGSTAIVAARPAVVASVATIGSTSLNTGEKVTPSVVASVASIGSPLVGAATVVSPAVVACVATIGKAFLWLRYSGQTGTVGSTVTTSDKAPDQDPFESLNIGVGATFAYDNAHAIDGTQSVKVATGTTAGVSIGLWSTNTLPTTYLKLWFRIYLYVTASAVPGIRPLTLRNGNTHIGSLLVNGTTLGMSYGSAFNGGKNLTTAMPLNQWVRLEGYVIADATVGELQISLYANPDTGVPTETQTFSGLATGASPINRADMGQSNSSASSGPYWFAHAAVSSFGPIGPATHEDALVSPAVVPCIATIGTSTRWLRNDAEVPSNGTTLTTANTGSSTSDAWDAVNIGALAALTTDTTHAAHGLQSIKSVTGSPAANSLTEWTTKLTTGTVPTLWWRIYCYMTAFGATQLRVISARTGVTYQGGPATNSAGKIVLLNAAGGTLKTSTTTLPLNQWFRLEGLVTGDPSAGVVETKIFASDMDAITPDETLTSTAVNTGAALNRIDFGNPSSVASYTFWWDDPAASVFGYIGPAGQEAILTPGVVACVATIGAPTVGASIATPAVVSAVASIGTATVKTGDTATPAVIPAPATIGAATVKTGETATPAVVNVSATITTPTVSTVTKATPAVVSATATIGSPSVHGSAVASPPVVAAHVTISIPAPNTGSLVQAVVIACVAAIAEATVIAALPYTPGPWTLGEVHMRWSLGSAHSSGYSLGEAHQGWSLGSVHSA